MQNTSETSKKMIILMGILFLIECIAGVIFFNTVSSSIGFIIGLLIGTGLSIIKLILLEKALIKSMEMEKKTASTYINRQYFFRYLITAIVLVISAINHPTINLFGVGIGLINMQISAYIYGLFFSSK